ncbi:Ribosomal protein S18 acetylase RimI and related acetyltransferases, partial [Mycobacterium rhizamassiliense]
LSHTIRRVTPSDAADIADMIHGLAEFERAPDQCTVTETQITAALFAAAPTVFGHVAEVDGEVAGMALWFLSFSTWDGVAGIYLEDLFVRNRFAVAALPARCLRPSRPNASTTATPDCRGRC